MSAQKNTAIALQMRIFAIFLGIILFFWLPVEDTTETWAIIFAIATSIWLAIAFFVTKRAFFQAPLFRAILAGTLAGILVTPLALLLMVFKTGLHGHEAPDYTTQQFLSVIYRTPIWIVGGLLIGMGSGIWITQQQTKPRP